MLTSAISTTHNDNNEGATEEETAGPMQYCLYIFYTSKFYELLDTVLMVLKKKPLGFLHVYHHTIVLAMYGCARALTLSRAPSPSRALSVSLARTRGNSLQ